MKINLAHIDKGNYKGKRPRFPNNLEQRLLNGQYCYLEKFPVKKLDATPTEWWNLNPKYVSMIRNCSYKILQTAIAKKDTQEKFNQVYNWFLWKPETIFSIDQEGIHAPLGMVKEFGIAHPGNERIIMARYLGIENVAVFTKKSLLPNDIKITSMLTNLEDIVNVYGPKISIFVTEDGGNLEVWYHKSGRMDHNGQDDIAFLGEQERLTSKCNDLIKYLIQNGIEVVYDGTETTRQNGIFTTKFRKKPSNQVYVVLNDKDLFNLDFWELFFHIDYKRRYKICHTGKLQIVNNINIDTLTYKSSLYKSLTRRMVV